MKIHAIVAANGPREYSERIDFSREHENWGLRGEIFFHTSTDKLPEIIKQLGSLGILEKWTINIRANFYQKLNHYVNLVCNTLINRDIDATLPLILNYLETNKLEITYKEGYFGYKINAQGIILDKWLLDDGGC